MLACERRPKATELMARSTRPPTGLSAGTPSVAYSRGYSLNSADDAVGPRRTRPARDRLTAFAPAVAQPFDGSLSTSDHSADGGGNDAPSNPYRGIGHPGIPLTHGWT
jgi:hypothetical protein